MYMEEPLSVEKYNLSQKTQLVEKSKSQFDM